MNNLEVANQETEDRFYAQFDSREVKLMTLDELAAAFEDGQIHGNTFVCREGESEWATLSEVAGLGDEPESEPPSVVVDERRPPMPARSAQSLAETRPPMPEPRPVMNTVPAARFTSAPPSRNPVLASSPLSFAPVSSTIEYPGAYLDDEHALRPERRWGRLLLAAAALTLVGGGAAFALGGGRVRAVSHTAPSPSTLNAARSEDRASVTLDSVQRERSKPAAAVPAAAAVAPTSETVTAAPGLSEGMKAALLAQDKAHASKHAAKVKTRGTASGRSVARHGKAPTSAAFKSGGSAYDPLNGKL